MKSKDPHEKIKQIKCIVCGESVMVDRWGQGECKKCKWFQGEYDLAHPNRIIDPNMVSLNKARELIKQGKPLEPTFDEFIEAYENYGEMEFWHKNRTYGLLMGRHGEPDVFHFYEKNVKGSVQTYKTVQELKENAHIGGKRLKDIWHEVERAGYMST